MTLKSLKKKNNRMFPLSCTSMKLKSLFFNVSRCTGYTVLVTFFIELVLNGWCGQYHTDHPS